MAELPEGAVFAGHRIERFVDRGGMGVIYEATDLELERRVAIKVISDELAVDPDFRQRFTRESRAAAQIRHPHVVPVYRAGEEQGVLFVSMAFIEGADLGKVITSERPLAPERVTAVIEQVAGALDEAHARGLVHRDVKPENVLIERHGSREHAYLTDFGLAKRVTAASRLTHTGMFLGTFHYAAPEQLRGDPVDARTDVYALGCVLYHALAGEVPFPRETPEAVMFAHIEKDLPSLAGTRPELPQELDAVIRQATAKSPDDRYQSAGDLGRAAVASARGDVRPRPIGSVATGPAATARARATVPSPPAIEPAATKPSPPRPVQQPEAAPNRPQRPRTAVGVALLAAGAIAVGVIALTSSSDDGGDSDEPAQSTAVPSGAVARVGDATISETAYDHWAAIDQRSTKHTAAQRQQKVMQFLTSAEWVQQEADARGIEVSDEEVQNEFEDQKKQAFETEKDYEEFVAESGQTDSDLLFRVKIDLLSSRIRADVTEGEDSASKKKLRDYAKDFKAKYRALTTCAEGYVVRDVCSNA